MHTSPFNLKGLVRNLKLVILNICNCYIDFEGFSESKYSCSRLHFKQGINVYNMNLEFNQWKIYDLQKFEGDAPRITHPYKFTSFLKSS